MSLDTSSLIDLAITSAEIQHGRKLNRISFPVSALSNMQVITEKAKAPKWSAEEDEFLRLALGYMSEENIALELGRTVTAIHIHWKRDMHLRAPSKAEDVITAQGAADALGIDPHKTEYWVDAGLIPGRLLAAPRKIRLIKRVTFMRWACAPRNWVYFDPKKVQDPHLKRLLKLEARRWGDEWWTTRQVADYHKVDTKFVASYITKGWLPALQPEFTIGGRNFKNAWRFWFVLKSEAIRPDFHFRHRGEDCTSLTPRGKIWLKKALKMGLNCSEIGRSMGGHDPMTILNWVNRNFPELKPKAGGAGHSKKARRAR